MELFNQQQLDKFAIEFASFCEVRDTYLERITLEELLVEFKKEHVTKENIVFEIKGSDLTQIINNTINRTYLM